MTCHETLDRLVSYAWKHPDEASRIAAMLRARFERMRGRLGKLSYENARSRNKRFRGMLAATLAAENLAEAHYYHGRI